MKIITRSELEEIENLALYAKRFDTEELYDSPEGIEAENALFDAVRPLLDNEIYERLEDYCLKATLTERIDAAVEVVVGQIER
jgi:hypothetical protein